MRKSELIDQLRAKLVGLPPREVEERLSFYGEMIDDQIEDGASEEDAVARIGSVEDIVSQILESVPLGSIVRERIRKRRRRGTWEVVLLVLGSPIWGALLITAFAIVFSVLASVWSVALSLWSVFAALAGSALGCLVGGVLMVFFKGPVFCMVALSAAFICGGLSILLFFGCREVTRGMIIFTKKAMLGIKRCFVGKGDAE